MDEIRSIEVIKDCAERSAREFVKVSCKDADYPHNAEKKHPAHARKVWHEHFRKAITENGIDK